MVLVFNATFNKITGGGGGGAGKKSKYKTDIGIQILEIKSVYSI